MKRLWSLALATVVFLAPAIHANPISMDISGAGYGSLINFTGGSSPSFSFSNAIVGAGTGYTFQIDNVSYAGGPKPGIPPAAGLYGNINGTFDIGTVTTTMVNTGSGFIPLYTAPVTNNGGQLVIDDGAGNFLTADLNFYEIATLGQIGGINSSITNGYGKVNLLNFTYSGTNTDLLELVKYVNGSISLTFQFEPAMTLLQLTQQGGSTSISGSLTAVPTPAAWVMLSMGGTLLGFVGYRRKQVK